MIEVIFYSCTADNRVVDKTNFLTRQSTKECNFYNQTGVMHPSILLAYDANIVTSCNYFQISSWNRWYYITGIEVMPGGRMVVTGSEDVLFSNKDEILNLTCNIIRQENLHDPYIYDKLMQQQSSIDTYNKFFDQNPFGDLTSGAHVMLTVVGGVSVST